MSSKEPVVVRSVATYDDLVSAPIDPSWIIEGSPQGRFRYLDLSPDITIGATLWEGTAGQIDWHYRADEVIQILEGEVEITPPSGLTTTLHRGDVVFFPGGQIVRWHIRDYVKKIVFTDVRASTTRRLAQRVPFARQLVHRLRAARARS